MQIDLTPGSGNVIRFPVERRAAPTLDTLRDVAPDVRGVLLAADTYGLEQPPHALRDAVDARTAEHILDTVPARPGAERRRALDAMLARVIDAALQAVRAWHDGSRAAFTARQRRDMAERSGSGLAEHLQERAAALSVQAAVLVVEAHMRCEEAEGVGRAVGFARRGETWGPVNRAEQDEWLIAMGARRQV